MKQRILIVALAVMMAVYLTGCGTTYQEATGQAEGKSGDDFGKGYFAIISEWEDVTYGYKIVYANDTKVKYFVCNSISRFGITPLYNADGTLQIYEESED